MNYKKTNIAVVGVNDLGRAFVRHVKSRLQFEKGFSLDIISVYDRLNRTHADVKNIPVAERLESMLQLETLDAVADFQQDVNASYETVRAALDAGKHTITTNATMVAVHGEKLMRIAESKNIHFKFSAAVLGGVPVVQSLQNGADSWYISRVHGVLNSTCNYVLKRMRERHVEREDAVSAAVELGYAHRNPDFDISGKDTLYKLALLSAVSYNTWPDVNKAEMTPLDDITLTDIKLAENMGFNIRYVGSASAEGLNIGPVLLQEQTLLGQMDGTLTGVVIDGDQVGSVFMAGYGADTHAITASVVSDALFVGRQRPIFSKPNSAPKRQHMERAVPRYFVRLSENTPLQEHAGIEIINETNITEKTGETYRGIIVETRTAKENIATALNLPEEGSLVLNLFME